MSPAADPIIVGYRCTGIMAKGVEMKNILIPEQSPDILIADACRQRVYAKPKRDVALVAHEVIRGPFRKHVMR